MSWLLHRRVRRLATLVAVPVALGGSALFVTGSSYSVFSASTSAAGSQWSTGAVSIANDSSTALFNAASIKPGDIGSRCITVTSTSSVPTVVKLYGTAFTDTNSLGSVLNLTVTQGTGSSFTDTGCSGFTPLSSGSSVFTGTLASFSNASGYGTGLPVANAWTPTGTATRVYKFEWSLPTTVTNTSQSGSAAIGFTWEAQSA